MSLSAIFANINLVHNLYISDFQDGNILIDEEEKAHLVDFGFPGVWPVKMVPERNVFVSHETTILCNVGVDTSRIIEQVVRKTMVFLVGILLPTVRISGACLLPGTYQ